MISKHDSGLSFIAAPTFPDEGEFLRGETLSSIILMLRERFQYIIADLPHDFSETSLSALDAYTKLCYPSEKIKPVLSASFPRSSLSKEKIETAMGMEFLAAFPHVADLVVEAINLGRPLVLDKPQERISTLLEDFAFFISKKEHDNRKPEKLTEAWSRVYTRYQNRKK